MNKDTKKKNFFLLEKDVEFKWFQNGDKYLSFRI